MSQHDYVIDNASGAAVRSDINSVLSAIATKNLGATTPSTTYPYQWWYDDSEGILKLRNGSNTAWLNIWSRNLQGNTFYLNGTGDALEYEDLGGAVLGARLLLSSSVIWEAFLDTSKSVFQITTTDDGAAEGPWLRLVRRSTTAAANDQLAEIQLIGQIESDGALQNYASVKGHIGSPTSGAAAGELSAEVADGSGSFVEVWRVTSSGLFVGKTGVDQGATSGIELRNTGKGHFTRDNATVLVLNRLSVDGRIVAFQHDGTTEGSIDVTGTTVDYNTFTGTHYAQWADGEEPSSDPPVGTLLSTVDEKYERYERRLETGLKSRIRGKGRSERRNSDVHEIPKPQLTAVKITSVRGDSRVYGTFAGRDSETDDIKSRGLGTDMVRVIGPIVGGDLLWSSATPGVAEAQPDDIIRSSTVGKVSRGDGRTDERLVACVLYCG